MLTGGSVPSGGGWLRLRLDLAWLLGAIAACLGGCAAGEGVGAGADHAGGEEAGDFDAAGGAGWEAAIADDSESADASMGTGSDDASPGEEPDVTAPDSAIEGAGGTGGADARPADAPAEDSGATAADTGAANACASGGARVFVTSGRSNGNLGGLAGADAKCTAAAAAASLGGTWAAWLSDSTTAAANRIHKASGPYVLVDGTAVAANYAALLQPSGSLSHAIDLSEQGSPVGSAGVWTGTDLGGGQVPGFCSDWTSTGPSTTAGNSGQADSRWTSADTPDCDSSYRLYCFETCQ